MGLQAAILERDSTVGDKSTEEGLLSVGKSQALDCTPPSAQPLEWGSGKPAESASPSTEGPRRAGNLLAPL